MHHAPFPYRKRGFFNSKRNKSIYIFIRGGGVLENGDKIYGEKNDKLFKGGYYI